MKLTNLKPVEIKEEHRPRDFEAFQLRLASPEKIRLKNQKLSTTAR